MVKGKSHHGTELATPAPRAVAASAASVALQRDSKSANTLAALHAWAVCTDDSSSYQSLKNHESVKHSRPEYVRGPVHTNGVESFWSMLKRAHAGTFHKLSEQHLQRYVNEFAGRQNLRSLGTLDQMRVVFQGLIGKRLTYKCLVEG